MSKGLRTAYFPGCTLKTNAHDFESSFLVVAKSLGIEVPELTRWNCCGTVYSLDTLNLIPRMASAHNLVRAEEEGFSEIITLCSMCYNTLKQTNNFLTAGNNKLATINDFLYLDPDYSGQIKVYHYLEFLRKKINPEQFNDLAPNSLKGMAVAPYYGCLLLRPSEIAIDDPENPEILTPFLSALGLRVIDFPLKNECCGAYQITIHQEAVARRTYRILRSAQSEGADILAVSCPLCHYNLARLQPLVQSSYPDLKTIPIAYFTELMAQAMGLNYKTSSRGLQATIRVPTCPRSAQHNELSQEVGE